MADLGRQLADLLYGESQQPKETTGQKIARRLTGAGETAATIGTGLLGSVPAGLAGLSQLIPTRGRAPDVNRAAQKVEDVQSALTYLPRTETGQRYLENTAGALEMLGAPAEYLGEKALQYTGSPAAATAANVLLDPVNFIGMPGSGKATVAATKAAGRAAMAAPRVAGEMVSDLLTPKSRFESQRGAIKMKGGNWFAGEVESELAPLKTRTGGGMDQADALQEMRRVYPPETTNPDILRRQEPIMRSLEQGAAINNWIDKKLNRYIKNEMGTPEDPVRKLADQGITHLARLRDRVPSTEFSVAQRRAEAGFPAVGYAETALGQNWERATDRAIIPNKAGDYLGAEQTLNRNPWLQKLPEDAPVYESGAALDARELGFDHLIDVLKEDLATGRIRPEQLEKMSMEQAVRRAHQYDQEMAEKAAKATAAAREGLPVYKEYPQGYRWIELNKPGAFSAESDAMGHSVRGYEPPKGHPDWTEGSGDAGSLYYGHGGWEGIKSGDAKVYSLVDSKGAPHVTVEIKKKTDHLNWRNVPEEVKTRMMEQAIKDADAVTDEAGLQRWSDENAILRQEKYHDAVLQWIDQNPIVSNEITQIKGKQNRAPKEEYLPFVQDFVKSGQWSDVRDFQNTGLVEIGRGIPWPKGTTSEQIDSLVGGMEGSNKTPKYTVDQFFEQAKKDLGSKYVTEQQMQDWITKQIQSLPEGKARGGSVRISDNPDTMRLELANGGAVKMVAGGLTAAKGAAKAGAKGAAKAAKEEKLSVPYNIPRAPAKTKEEIRPIAQRMAEQMTGEFIRPNPKISKNPAEKTYQQFLMEKELEGHHQYRKTKDVPEPQVADIEKQQGMVKFGISGDTTMADTELLRAGPYQMEDPVPLHGGPRFPLGGEGAWASNNPIAANVQRRIGEMSQFFDAPVLGQYMAMGPSGSMFAQHLADANLQAIDLSKMTKRQIEQFNRLIREGNKESGPRPTFPGIQDKNEAYLWMAFDPKLRIHFNELMQKPTVTGALNLPDGRIILDAVTEPELRNKEIMTSGLSQFQFDPSVRPEDLPLSMHPTYTHLIPMKQGAPVTRTRYPTPAELEFSDVANFIRQNYPAKEFTRTMQTSSPRQLIDQQAIDEIRMFEEFMKQYTGKKKGGAIEMASGGGVGEKRDLASKIAGGGIRGVITRGLLGMDPPEDMTPREREIYENMARMSAPAQGLGVGKAIFIGATAKTWNKAAAARAVELEKAGVTPEQIWRETGTFRGADGKLRQEISDVGAVHRNPKELQELGKAKKEEARELQLRLVGTPGQKDLFPKALTEAKRPVREQVKQLKEEAFKLMLPSDTRGQSARFALEHPELYKAYPELADIPVYQGVTGSGRELGSLRGAAGDLEMSVTQSGLRQSPRSTMLHEMQHAVQSLEGMSPGGSSAMAFQDPKAFEILKQIRQKASEPMTYDKYLETLIEANPGKKLSDINPDVARQGYESYLRSIPESVKKFDRDFQVQAANEYYKRLAGEAEARATQYREGMGPTQRRQEFPYSSYDVLPDDLIVKPPRTGLPITAEAAKPTAEQAAAMAAQRAEMELRSRAMQELRNQFENLPQPPKGFLSPENILQRMDEIRRREATPPNGQIPLLKKGGKVKFTDNLDTMRLAVQKRK